MLRFALSLTVALAVVLNAGAATRAVQAPPPGAQMSDSLEYVARVPGTSQVVEGKFDRAQGRDILIITGRFGFKTLDVSDPSNPRVLDTFQPAEILGPNGYWQDEDMDIDVRRNLILGALDPRHDNVDQASCPGIGTLGSKTGTLGCPASTSSRTRIRRTSSRWATSSTCPRATRSAASTSATTSGPAARHAARIRPTWAPSRRAVAATAGRSGSRISATRRARSCSRPDRPRPQRRADRLLARRRRRRQRHRVGQRSRWADGVCDPGPVA